MWSTFIINFWFCYVVDHGESIFPKHLLESTFPLFKSMEAKLQVSPWDQMRSVFTQILITLWHFTAAKRETRLPICPALKTHRVIGPEGSLATFQDNHPTDLDSKIQLTWFYSIFWTELEHEMKSVKTIQMNCTRFLSHITLYITLP